MNNESVANYLFLVFKKVCSEAPIILVTSAITLISLLVRINKMYLLSPKITYKKLKEDQLENWDKNEANLNYKVLKKKMESFEEEKMNLLNHE